MPTQPEPAKTVLIIASDRPKSEMIKVGRSRAIASSAAVDDTVAKAEARANADLIEPAEIRTALGSMRC